ncbi:hypothetical protein OKJ48_38950 [Streptomyces kunmingensis]|uniref:Uncharacterized protein n=1 Tax=Streptomyces kunmingensis TaxID=68225 RepID=A0ABU6CNC8_9ACTN|nr:hypothetical protein [Streptomyces kunmingensis]MEB3966162.1 hypothetical protein [Streptomyces kunmingensis]
MTEQDVEARVDELVRGLRRMAAGLWEAAAEHPQPARARELSAAARALTNTVLPRLDGETVEADPAGRSGPEVRDTVPAARSTALEELIELYVADYARRLDEPVMTDPDLPYGQWKHLHRVVFGRDGDHFEHAPLWNDAVPSRGRAVVRGVTSQAEVLRRMHHRYVLRRDLDSAEGALAVQVLHACDAIRGCRAIKDAGFVALDELDLDLENLKWRALVTAAGRGAEAGSRLRELLGQVEVLATVVLELDTRYRQHGAEPALSSRIAGAAQGVQALALDWRPDKGALP